MRRLIVLNKLWSKIAFGVFLIICFSANALAQKTETTPPSTKSGSQTVKKPTAFCRSNTEAFLKIRLLIEQSKRFQDLEPRIRGVAELSSLLWQCDSSAAEASFQELHQMIRSEIAKRQPSSKLAPVNSATRARDDGEQTTLAKLKYLNSYLLSLIYRRNPNLAKRLASTDDVEWGEINYDTVKGLLENGDTKKAAAELRHSIKSGAAYGTASQLTRLRQEDTATADSLYRSYLETLANRTMSAEEVMQAGVYLFVGSVPVADHPGLLEVFYLDHTPVPRFLTRQPGATDDSIRAYLNLVATLLSRPTDDLAEQKRRYALGRVLLMQVPQNETELMVAFVRGLQKLSLEVTDALKNDQIYQSISSSSSATESVGNLDQQLEGLEKIPSTTKRDELCTMLAHSLYSRRHPAEALRVVRLMSLSETRSQLETTIIAAIAFDLLKHDQLIEARQLTEKITAGPARSLLFLKFAEALRQAKDAPAADQLMGRAIDDARKSDEPKRGLLLIKAASFFMEQDLLFAEQLFLEAINSINSAERWRTPSWGTDALAHGAILMFRFGGAEDIRFPALIEPLVRKDFGQTEVFLNSLKSEQLRVEGFVVLSKYLIDKGSFKEKSRTKG